MIRRLVAWVWGLVSKGRSLYRAFREYSGFEYAVVQATAYGVYPQEIGDAATHPKLMGDGTYGRATILAMCLKHLAIVGIPLGVRVPILVGIVLRYQECNGPGVMPDHLLHNCSTALAHSVGRGRVAREEYAHFVEALPQFRSTHGLEPGSDRLLQWFMSSGKPSMGFQHPIP